ncbi:oxygen-independent coproporphyrinogen III oxidase [Zhongshania arctica]|uniref:Coproporphyrinogen-III oxidase n=1 Tax=Zhongshania arctica TaxID=3238302 RepID=A0ABV3TV54_9GAMM
MNLINTSNHPAPEASPVLLNGINKTLSAKYSGPGPRYTSYPTALQFNTDFTEKEYRKLLREARKSDAPLSLYVHVPFCRWLCYYCACNKIVTKDPTVSQHYLAYLNREIEMLSKEIGNRRHVTQLHFGGGTPTFLDDAELTELIHSLASHFNLDDDSEREYSIEIDPRTVDGDRLALLRGLGFNRLSFGVQDTNPNVQAAVNRRYDFQQLKSLMAQARSYRFNSIAIDLIYGLPKQTLSTMTQTLDDVISLSPDRIAFYHYAHMPERFPAQRAINRHTVPNSDQKLEMLCLAAEKFAQAGYVHIGMDHFVKKADSLAICQTEGRLQRNFQGYSTCLAPDVLAMGASSISSILGNFSQNHKDLHHYYDALDNGHLPVAKGLISNQEDRLRNYVISQLICNLSLDFDTFRHLFGIDFRGHFKTNFDALKELEHDGILKLSEQGIIVTDIGRNLLRNICMVFDNYLDAETSAYSKTL